MAEIKALCVYCGASEGHAPVYADAARRLGAAMAERGIRLVYGGGRVGLMGVLADAVLRAGGDVTGVIPGHLHDREVGHDGVSELVVVDSMHERKMKMSELADAFASLPGGLGTLDETFEIVTWKQLGLHDKPIVLIDVEGYWRPLHKLIRSVVSQGFAREGHAQLFTTVPDIDELFEAIAAAPAPSLPTDTEHM